MIKPWHILVVLIVLLIIFGASKLPDIAKSFGQSAKVLKKELRELQEDDGSAPSLEVASETKESEESAEPVQKKKSKRKDENS